MSGAAYQTWRDAVHALGGVATVMPYTGWVGGGGTVDPNVIPAARFDLTTGSALVGQGRLPAVTDATSTDHRYWYYLAPPEVIAESFDLGQASDIEGRRAGNIVLSNWVAWAGTLPLTAAKLIPWWAWAAGAVVVANALGLLKRKA
jgi:hypothetical protein